MCGTNLIFHMQQGLEIPSISALYEEAHCLNHTAMRLKGDPVVNAAMDNAIEHESQFVRKGSVVVRAEKVHSTAMNLNCVGDEFPAFPDNGWTREKHQLAEKIKKTVKVTLREAAQESNIAHLNTLLVQGEYLKFSLQEKKDPVWKSFIWNLKKGTAKFLINSTIHTLPTQNNLKLWNKAASDKCHLCGNRDSTKHTLSACKVALDQGKYTWRQDSILQYVADSLEESNHSFYVDIPGKQHSNGGTIPTEANP